MLDADEQELVARLSVFAGGSTLEAAETVCDATIDRLASLVEKSLLARREGRTGYPRFALLETVREYAREQLDERGETDEIARRHAEHFLALVEEAVAERPDEDIAATRALYHELDNLRLALATVSASGDVERELRFATAAFWSLWTRASPRELRTWLDAALSRGGGADSGLRADALGAAALAAVNSGDSEAGRQYARQSLALARERDDSRQIEWALRVLSFDEPDLDERRRLLQECARLCRELANENGLGWVTNLLGLTLLNEGKLDEAEETLTRSMRTFDGLDKPWEAANAELGIGHVLIAAGRHAEVRPIVERAITTGLDLDSASLLGESFVLLAAVSLDADPAAVPRLLRATQALSDAGHPPEEQYGRPLFEETQQAARELLGEQFEREWEAGALTAEEALELARRSP